MSAEEDLAQEAIMRQVARKTGHETPAEARYRRLFAERRRGESLRAFAARIGMAPGTLAWWRHELRCRDAARERRGGERESPALLPVRVVAAEAAAAIPSALSAPAADARGYEVALAGGRRVLRVPAGFDAAVVRALVMAVEGAPC